MFKVPVLPTVGMLMAECAQVGLMMVSKAAMSDGMSNIIFIFYSNALASLILLPSSLLFHRSQRPSLTFSIIGGFLLLGLLGSPTLGTALLNLIPGFTYILAVTLRMETLNWRSSSSQAKSIGTIILILGAFIVTLYKGPSLSMASSSSSSSSSNLSYTELLFQQPNWVLGGLLLTADCVSASAWLIVQASILKQYPAELIMVLFYCFFVAILSAVFGLVLERDLSAWSLKSKLRFSAVVYSIAWINHNCCWVLLCNVGEIQRVTAMVTMEACTIILTIWAKTVITNGMSPFVFVVYTHALSSIFLIPFSFFYHRNDRNDEEPVVFNLNLFLRLFLLGLTGITIPQNLAFLGLSYSSPIVVCAMGLTFPSLSFLLSILLRTTKVNWRSRSFQTKVCGTIVSLVGATMVEFQEILIFSSNNTQYWVLGGLLLAAANLCVSFWNTLQAGTVKQYPQVMKVASFYSTIGTLQSALLSALIFERDLNAWKLDLNTTQLLLIVLTASFMGVIRSCVHLWCMKMKGPLYVPMFKPFGVVFATIFGTSLPASTLRYGSVIGTAIVGMGYFTVMWGQLNHEDEVSSNSNNTKQYDVESPPQEYINDDDDDDDDDNNIKTPLLKPQQNYVQ
ncbi:hypothetical protein F8388_015229 [Cannabis sativa]|uniref:EamA domain-containing protein n=1 Tax=Cannabis sativa TaxID=3483 RepID=A0A7J6EAK0_CANSA|nr:hypothetical protein F8388_015229 [Cannabis sativa]